MTLVSKTPHTNRVILFNRPSVNGVQLFGQYSGITIIPFGIGVDSHIDNLAKKSISKHYLFIENDGPWNWLRSHERIIERTHNRTNKRTHE
ncbi:hypothetical protein DPMN_011538 [Dreissena polymorpha]|uniref:Uncharacterized protein n=1 Tax=Dreissena polymorpha TaxID=45954 RepID=A0A9D4S0D0_DREPO|nr:hypothetical protein DPMN_011538 [Dreissena polymorpha]